MLQDDELLDVRLVASLAVSEPSESRGRAAAEVHEFYPLTVQDIAVPTSSRWVDGSGGRYISMEGAVDI